MSTRNRFTRSRRALLLACCILVVPAKKTWAQNAVLLASDLSTHSSSPDLRPAADVASADPSLVSSSAAVSSAPPDPGTMATPDSTAAVSAPADSNLPGPIPPSGLPPAAPPSSSSPELASNNSKFPNAAAGDPPTPAPSQNATINLINLMVKRKLISQDDADGLIRQAQQEADVARAQAVETQAKADRALAAQQVAATAPPQPSAPEPSEDETRVTYVPDVVKQQITQQVTQNVMEQTHQEELADTIAAREVPDWVKRFHVMGDIRLRYEDDRYPSGNAIGNFTNFNAINTASSGFNVNSATPQLPQYDVDQDRNRFRLRARIGAGIDLGDNFTAGMRIATGSDDNPVTENQTLGGANGAQGGNFAKYQVWLDRAFLRYEYANDAGNKDNVGNADLTVTVGRFDNPFFNTTMMWSNDLAFDGAVVKAKYDAAPGVAPFLTLGGFPVFNTDLNFSTDQSAKFDSEDKYLLAVQGGTHWNITKDFSFIGAVGYYDFQNIAGKVSDPIFTPGQDFGNTDDSRPSFAQNGNTYIALRDFEGPADDPTQAEPQYFGLATPYNVLSVTGQLDYSGFDPFHLSITGEFIKNLAFDRNAIINNGPASDPGPQNNTLSSDPNSFDGGDTGYLVHIDAGKVALENLWDWNVRLSYRYVETDATVDAFTDSDFGGTLTGTNLKGYTVEGQLALGSRVWTSLRWMSADNVSGPTFRNDLLQFDINAKF